MNEPGEEYEHRRGIPAARSNLWVARTAAAKYLREKAEDDPNPHDLMLYYGAFFLFARSALYALESSDEKLSPELNRTQKEYFQNHIANDPIFKMLKGERDRIGHGDDSWGLHPMMTLGMIDRFVEAGHNWSLVLFDEIWPDEPFSGEKIDVVMNKVWRSVSNWLDGIDAADQLSHESKRRDDAASSD